MAVSKMYRDKLVLSGINDQGKWVRISSLSHYDLEDDQNLILKLFGRSELTCWSLGRTEEDGFVYEPTRLEDCLMLREPKPKLLNEIKGEDKQTLVKSYIDGGVDEAFKRERTLGIIKPLVEEVYFGWNALDNIFESTFVFRDKSGQRYKFVCTDLKWHYSCIFLFQRKPNQIYKELNELPEKLNKKDTYFVIGLTKPFMEVPGAFKGSWPLILGIHSF